MDQRGLVERAGRGDHEAFGELVDASLARLDAAARLILRDAELARDAVQEAMVLAWRNLPGLRDPDRFDAWLHRLTVHSCIDMARRRRRRVIEVELTPLDDLPIADSSALVADRDFLDRALRRLDSEQRAMGRQPHVVRVLGALVDQEGGRVGLPARRGCPWWDRGRRPQVGGACAARRQLMVASPPARAASDPDGWPDGAVAPAHAVAP